MREEVNRPPGIDFPHEGTERLCICRRDVPQIGKPVGQIVMIDRVEVRGDVEAERMPEVGALGVYSFV